jgi:hypothetical protein
MNEDKMHKFFGSPEYSNDDNDDDSSSDWLLSMVECIFGYTPGQEIMMRNDLIEFLSAVIAIWELQDHLPIEALT